jgi:hypothetical protein
MEFVQSYIKNENDFRTKMLQLKCYNDTTPSKNLKKCKVLKEIHKEYLENIKSIVLCNKLINDYDKLYGQAQNEISTIQNDILNSIDRQFNERFYVYKRNIEDTIELLKSNYKETKSNITDLEKENVKLIKQANEELHNTSQRRAQPRISSTSSSSSSSSRSQLQPSSSSLHTQVQPHKPPYAKPTNISPQIRLRVQLNVQANKELHYTFQQWAQNRILSTSSSSLHTQERPRVQLDEKLQPHQPLYEKPSRIPPRCTHRTYVKPIGGKRKTKRKTNKPYKQRNVK